MNLKFCLYKVASPIATHTPLFISGSAFYHAIASRLTDDERRKVRCSGFNLVVPHRDWRGRIASLSKIDIKKYSDFRNYRTPVMSPLSGSDEVSLLRMKYYGEDKRKYAIIENECGIVKAKDESRSLYATCYIYPPIDDERLRTFHIGGMRNFGHGRLELAASEEIETDDLEMDVSPGWVMLASPYVLASDFPGVENHEFPRDWGASRGWREIEYLLYHRQKQFKLRCVDSGQVFAGDKVRNIWDGVRRIGAHSKYGFGEWYLA